MLITYKHTSFGMQLKYYTSTFVTKICNKTETNKNQF